MDFYHSGHSLILNSSTKVLPMYDKRVKVKEIIWLNFISLVAFIFKIRVALLNIHWQKNTYCVSRFVHRFKCLNNIIQSIQEGLIQWNKSIPVELLILRLHYNRRVRILNTSLQLYLLETKNDQLIYKANLNQGSLFIVSNFETQISLFTLKMKLSAVSPD